jgi:Uma2 family endonuclease
MPTYPKGRSIPYAPTEEIDLYPDSDGEPMAASDLHRDQLIWTLQALQAHFAPQPDVYISGDILMYYEKGVPRRVVAPDVLVVFGVARGPRRTYKVWEEGKTPDFAMEFSSESTYENDLTGKRDLYAQLGVQDYFLYDAEGLYLPSPLMGFQLVRGVYVEVPVGVDGGLRSPVLGLEFRVRDEGLGIYDPVAREWLQTPAEIAEARAEQEIIARQSAEARAEQAETAATELREQLARLQARP